MQQKRGKESEGAREDKLSDLLSVLQWGFEVFARDSIAGNEKIGLLHEDDKSSIRTTWFLIADSLPTAVDFVR